MAKESVENGWHDFLELCSKIKTPDAFNSFFSLFLTYEERETMGSRYIIIRELLEGKLTQREMAEKHKVSIAQITRGSNALKILDPEFRKKMEKMLDTHAS